MIVSKRTVSIVRNQLHNGIMLMAFHNHIVYITKTEEATEMIEAHAVVCLIFCRRINSLEFTARRFTDPAVQLLTPEHFRRDLKAYLFTGHYGTLANWMCCLYVIGIRAPYKSTVMPGCQVEDVEQHHVDSP